MAKILKAKRTVVIASGTKEFCAWADSEGLTRNRGSYEVYGRLTPTGKVKRLYSLLDAAMVTSEDGFPVWDGNDFPDEILILAGAAVTLTPDMLNFINRYRESLKHNLRPSVYDLLRHDARRNGDLV